MLLKWSRFPKLMESLPFWIVLAGMVVFLLLSGEIWTP